MGGAVWREGRSCCGSEGQETEEESTREEAQCEKICNEETRHKKEICHEKSYSEEVAFKSTQVEAEGGCKETCEEVTSIIEGGFLQPPLPHT